MFFVFMNMRWHHTIVHAILNGSYNLIAWLIKNIYSTMGHEPRWLCFTIQFAIESDLKCIIHMNDRRDGRSVNRSIWLAESLTIKEKEPSLHQQITNSKLKWNILIVFIYSIQTFYPMPKIMIIICFWLSHFLWYAFKYKITIFVWQQQVTTNNTIHLVDYVVELIENKNVPNIVWRQ